MVMTPNKRRLLVIGCALLMVAAATAISESCGAGSVNPVSAPTSSDGTTLPSSTTAAAVTTSSRPPLDDPPDPGPVPDDHGIDSDVLAEIVDSSVQVFGLSCNVAREGSGFAVLDGDLIATNAHVMIGVTEPSVRLTDGRELAASLVAFDAVNDLAVLHVDGAGLDPLPLSGTSPDGTVGAVLAWDDQPASGPGPAPIPFRIDRPVTVLTNIVDGSERIRRAAWLVAADVEAGHSGAGLVTIRSGAPVVVGVAWGASRRPDGGVGYATRADQLEKLLADTDISARVDPPNCR